MGISSADRDRFNADSQKAEAWLDDNMEGTKVQFVEKLDELKVIGGPVEWRFKEADMRDEYHCCGWHYRELPRCGRQPWREIRSHCTEAWTDLEGLRRAREVARRHEGTAGEDAEA